MQLDISVQRNSRAVRQIKIAAKKKSNLYFRGSEADAFFLQLSHFKSSGHIVGVCFGTNSSLEAFKAHSTLFCLSAAPRASGIAPNHQRPPNNANCQRWWAVCCENVTPTRSQQTLKLLCA
jgi:hypothetical protein